MKNKQELIPKITKVLDEKAPGMYWDWEIVSITVVSGMTVLTGKLTVGLGETKVIRMAVSSYPNDQVKTKEDFISIIEAEAFYKAAVLFLPADIIKELSN